MTSVPRQVLGLWVLTMPIRVVQERTTWWQRALLCHFFDANVSCSLLASNSSYNKGWPVSHNTWLTGVYHHCSSRGASNGTQGFVIVRRSSVTKPYPQLSSLKTCLHMHLSFYLCVYMHVYVHHRCGNQKNNLWELVFAFYPVGSEYLSWVG